MILAFNPADIIQVPFGYLLSWLYQLTNNYGVALIIFAIALKLILLPVTAKSKKTTMKMSRLTPRVQALKAKYGDDPQKLNEATQALYKEEGVGMGCSGCLWSFIPLLILLPLYTVVRQPLIYLLQENADTAAKIVETIKTALPGEFSKNGYYDQLIAAPLIPQFADQLKDVVANPATLEGMNFTFLGIDLGRVPGFNVFAAEFWTWASVGAFLMPILSAGGQVLSMLISQRMNNSLVTDETFHTHHSEKKPFPLMSRQTLLPNVL